MMILNLILQTNTVTDTIANAAASTDMNASITENISYLDFLLKGGVMIIPIILLLFFCFYVIIERYLSIKKATKQDANLVNEIKLELKTGKIQCGSIV
jgi:biopolymer transport protein ExbB